MNNLKQVLEEREDSYGSFKDNSLVSQNLKRAMRNAVNWDLLTPQQKEALEMVQHKISRILCGDVNYLDSWVDSIGYLQLIVNELEEINK